MTRIRVLFADDHVVVAKGLESLLSDSFELAGIVHDGRALVEAAEKVNPDVIITDISMPLLNGIEAIRQIRAQRHHPCKPRSATDLPPNSSSKFILQVHLQYEHE